MPNRIHVILVPSDETGLSRAVGETRRRYSGYINARLCVTDRLFQGRFGCVAMDAAHLLAAFRYVALNPVPESDQDQAGRVTWRLALVVGAGTASWRGRWLGEGLAAAGTG